MSLHANTSLMGMKLAFRKLKLVVYALRGDAHVSISTSNENIGADLRKQLKLINIYGLWKSLGIRTFAK